MKHAWRQLRAAPGVTFAALLSLALGIGASTALFSVTQALLLRPLPYANADRLVILWNRSPGLNITEDWFSTAQYFDIKHNHRGLDEVALAIGANVNLTGHREPERVGTIRVSANLLPMLGVRPVLGQLFDAADDLQGQAPKALLTYGTWVRRYGGDRGVVGASVILNGVSYAIAGVLPEGFSLPREVLPTLGVAEDGELFLPLPLAPNASTIRGREDYNIIGTLRPGVTVAQAQAEMDGITARLRREFPDVYPANGGLTFSIVPLMDQVVGEVRTPVLMLLGAVGCVLLIACANVANLLLARGLARRQELAIRASLGATPARLVRQLLTESLLLASLGAVCGAVLATAAVRLVQRLHPAHLPRLDEIVVDGPVLGFTIVVSLAAGVLFGLAPALHLRSADPQDAMKDASRGSSGTGALWARGLRLRRALVVAELALSVVLLVGAGLFLRSLSRLQHVAPGFNADQVLTLELTLTGPRYANGQAVQSAYRDLWPRLDRLPGVTASGGVTSLPLSGYFAWGPITVEGRIPPPGELFINVDQRIVAGRYFEAMHIPLLRGRLFDDHDTPDQPRVVIIDAQMATELWPGQDAVGKRIRFGDSTSTSPWQTVIGIVGRVKQYALDTDGRSAVYLPHSQSAQRALYVTVRTTGDVNALATPVRTTIREFDPDLPIFHMRPMTTVVSRSLGRPRFATAMIATFAATALLLSAIGLYGVMSYMVNQGLRDIGIRVALGASPRRVLALVLRQGLTVAIVGAGVGIAASLAVVRVADRWLFGVTSRDPLTIAGVALVLGLVVVAATWLPARRASRVNPVEALKS